MAPFYGCQILRPSKIMGFEDPDRPWSLERIIEACGGEAIDYPAKIKCCGFPIIAAREETALGEVIQPVEQAIEAGADVMVTPCPLCHLSLDAWQQKLEASTGRAFKMPILHLAQLVGVAAGLEEDGAEVQAPHRRPAAGARAAGSLNRLGALAGAAAGWGLLEAGWVRFRELELELPGLPPELDGLRIVHLSDFHFGVPSPGIGAAWRAAVWARERKPDLVAVSGDLLTHPRGEPMLRRFVRVLPRPTFAVLGNHDIALSRDPQARRSDLRELEPATLLRDDGQAARAAGPERVDRGSRPAADRARAGPARPEPARHERPTSRSCSATTRACSSSSSRAASTSSSPATCTTARSRSRSRAGRFASPIRRAPFNAGVYRSAAATMHVSAGLGTTFVPFRFAARPEATELVLRAALR